MDTNVKGVVGSGFLVIKKHLLYALNVKVLIGISQEKRRKCDAYGRIE